MTPPIPARAVVRVTTTGMQLISVDLPIHDDAFAAACYMNLQAFGQETFMRGVRLMQEEMVQSQTPLEQTNLAGFLRDTVAGPNLLPARGDEPVGAFIEDMAELGRYYGEVPTEYEELQRDLRQTRRTPFEKKRGLRL